MAKKSSKAKLLVIGLDGATFDIINPMIAEGKLPNISRLMSEGSYGVLQSSIPPLSPTAWSSFMTGTNPAKHGILDFFGRQPDSYLAKFYNASSRQEKAFWTIASEHKCKVGIINVPSTYPPEKVNGFMISGMDTPGRADDYIYPPELKNELKQDVGGYKLEEIDLRGGGDDSDTWAQELYKVMENRFAVAKHLMQKKDWDLFVLVFEATDRAQHRCWENEGDQSLSNTKNKHGNRKLVCEAYEKVDQKLGALLEGLDDDVYVVVLSDHGFGPVDWAVRLNLWLAQQEYLSFNRRSQWLGESFKKAKAVIEKMVWRYLRQNIKKLPKMKKSFSSNKPDNLNVLPGINWTKTRAYCIGGMGNIFINLKGREPAGTIQAGVEYESVVDELMGKLQKMIDPLTGRKVFYKVYKRSEAYCGKLMEKAPDILLEWAKGYSFIGERERIILGIKDYSEQDVFIPHLWAGNHLPNGIIIFRGKDIKKGAELKNANITDIAPTILYLMGLPIANNMDGHVLTSAIKDEFISANPMEYQETTIKQESVDSKSLEYTEEEAEQIKRRLQGLGYIE